jgi:PAS domain S-box-containing protein
MAVEAADIGLWDWDPATRRLQWDDRSHALFGLPMGAPVDDQVFLNSLHPGDRVRVQDAIEAALDPEGSGDYDIEYRTIGCDGVERWIAARGRAVFEGGRAVRFLGAMSDITQSKRIEAENARLYDEAQREIAERTRAQEHLQLLIHELNHRVKNTLATVQSIAVQSLRRAASPEAARQVFTDRLIALSKAHDVLTAENWEGADLHDVVLGAVEPFRSAAQHRFLVSGPPVRLTPKTALALAMAFHELGTNAAKYGALSAEERARGHRLGARGGGGRTDAPAGVAGDRRAAGGAAFRSRFRFAPHRAGPGRRAERGSLHPLRPRRGGLHHPRAARGGLAPEHSAHAGDRPQGVAKQVLAGLPLYEGARHRQQLLQVVVRYALLLQPTLQGHGVRHGRPAGAARGFHDPAEQPAALLRRGFRAGFGQVLCARHGLKQGLNLGRLRVLVDQPQGAGESRDHLRFAQPGLGRGLAEQLLDHAFLALSTAETRPRTEQL